MRARRAIVGLGAAVAVLTGAAAGAPAAAPPLDGAKAPHAAAIRAGHLVGVWVWLDADEAFPNPGRAVQVRFARARGRLTIAFPGSPPARATWSRGRRRLAVTVRRRLVGRTGLVPVRYLVTVRRADRTIRLSGRLTITDPGYGGASAVSAARRRTPAL